MSFKNILGSIRVAILIDPKIFLKGTMLFSQRTGVTWHQGKCSHIVPAETMNVTQH